MRRLADDGGRVQQGLGGNAADVEADPAQVRVALDQHGVHAKVRGAEGGGVAAGAGAEDEHFALEVRLAPRFLRRLTPSPACWTGSGRSEERRVGKSA